MKQKNSIITIVVFLIGIGLGKSVFGESQNKSKVEKHANEITVEHWTCSMHPQIDRPESGQCPICGMDLIPKNQETQTQTSPDAFNLSEKALALAQVETLKIGEKKFQEKGGLNLSGRVTENQENTATQVAHISGRIEKMYVESEGDFVKKGQRIALIYSPELVAAQNELLQALNIKNEQPELYKSVRNKLKYWKLRESQIQALEKNKKTIEKMPIYADYSGYITKIKANEGTHLKEGGPLYELTDLSSLWVIADVYEKDLPRIHKGQKIKLVFNAFPGENIEGRIDYIEPTINPKTRTAKARIILTNKNKKYKPGMLAQILLSETKDRTKSEEKQFIIPKTAVLWTGKRSVVYVKIPGKKPLFELRKVVIGNSYGDNIEVVSGLKPGDEVVVNGVFSIDASAQLQGKPSMMNPQGGKTKNKHEGMEM